MSFHSGSSRSIIHKKMQTLIRVLDEDNSRVIKMAILSQLLLTNENPAYYASMIVSLKKSGLLVPYARETNDPSFNIDDIQATVENKPSPYLESYQASQEFLNHEEIINYPNPSSPISVANIILKRNGSTVASIIAGR